MTTLATRVALDLAQPALDVDQLFREHAGFIGRLIQQLAGAGPHVDDILQETFVVAFNKRKRFDHARATPRTWLYGIASNLCRRHHRGHQRFSLFRRKLSLEPTSAPPTPDQALDRKQATTAVHAALDRLPFKQREVFVLYELEGLEGEQIAGLVGAPLNTVWTRLHHARKTFRELIRRDAKKTRGLR